jgi:hypothetical protein
MSFSKIVIYGHKLHSHTHSYIFYGFYKAFKYLEYETLWIDETDDVSNVNFDNSLFLTETQVENNIPINKSSKYIAHTMGISYTTRAGEQKRSADQPLNPIHSYDPNIILDLFNYHSIIGMEKINYYTYIKNKILIQPWATDLLPHEFDFVTAKMPRKPEAYFFGSVVESGWNNNFKEITAFENDCIAKNIKFDYRGLYTKGPIDPDLVVEQMKGSMAAPIIQSEDQIDSGYLTDRLFKNISYGHYCMTNSSTINNLMPTNISNIIYEKPENMLDKLFELENKDISKDILLNQMKYVQDNHTYVNRINTILNHL